MNETYTIELKERQMAFIKEMVEKHNLPDESKAIRCLINFAMQETGHETSIFTELRCLHC